MLVTCVDKSVQNAQKLPYLVRILPWKKLPTSQNTRTAVVLSALAA